MSVRTPGSEVAARFEAGHQNVRPFAVGARISVSVYAGAERVDGSVFVEVGREVGSDAEGGREVVLRAEVETVEITAVAKDVAQVWAELVDSAGGTRIDREYFAR